MKKPALKGTPKSSETASDSFGVQALKAEMGVRIRAVLAESGGQKLFSDSTGVSTSTIANHVAGTTEAKPSFLKVLSEYSGVSIHWLVTGDGPKHLAGAANAPFNPARMQLASKLAVVVARDGALPEGFRDEHEYAAALYQVLGDVPPPARPKGTK